MKRYLFLLYLIPLFGSAQIQTRPEDSYGPANIISTGKNMGMGPLGYELNFLGNPWSSTHNIGIGTEFKTSVFAPLFFYNDGKLTIRHNSTLSNSSGSNGPQLILDEYDKTDFARLRFRNSWSETNLGDIPTYTYTRSPRYWDIAGFSNGATSGEDKLNFFNSDYGNILTIRGDGNVGILNGNPGVPLHINSPAISSNSSSGAMILGLVGGLHLTFDSNEINSYSNTSSASLYLNDESNGDVNIGSNSNNSNLVVNGFAKFGGSSSPGIKMLKLEGNADSDNHTAVSHGLDKAKIVSFTVMMNSHSNVNFGIWYNPGSENASTAFTVVASDLHVVMSNVGAALQGNPYKILIMYEE